MEMEGCNLKSFIPVYIEEIIIRLILLRNANTTIMRSKKIGGITPVAHSHGQN
jgi:hypothetical protein